MLEAWIREFWLWLACLAAGTLVVGPLLLSRSFRRRFARTDLDLPAVGLIVLIVILLCIGVPNWLRDTA